MSKFFRNAINRVSNILKFFDDMANIQFGNKVM